MFKNINIVYCWYFKMNTLWLFTLFILKREHQIWQMERLFVYFSIIIIGLHCIICFAPHYKSDTYEFYASSLLYY